MRKFNKKTIVLLVSLVLVLSVSVGATLAFLLHTSGSLKNTFTPSSVTTDVDEEITVNGKEDVTVKNTGNTDAFIRAAVVVTWQNSAGDVYGQKPVAGTDYTIDFDFTNGWVEGKDGFYYYTSPVAPGESTDVLIESCVYNGNVPEGYGLCVEIIGSGVQAVPVAAVEEWSGGLYTVDAAGAASAMLKLK